MAELNRIQKFFSDEVARQINQFAIDIVDAIMREVDQELDMKAKVLGLTKEQYSTFQAVLRQAETTVLSKYGLQVSNIEDTKRRMKQ